MSRNLYEAHRQWAVRPRDERFSSLDALSRFVSERRSNSVERRHTFRDLSMVLDHDEALALNGQNPVARFSHWSFGQFCEWLKAPAPYLRRLPAPLVADCLQFSISMSPANCQMLVRGASTQSGESESTIAAITGPKYGRIWDADIVEALSKSLQGNGWHVPPAASHNGSEFAGLYASDRDMFAFFVNDEAPIEVDGIKLGRGFFCWNSETGAASFGLTTFLYNYVCGNHIVWGADQIQELRIIHRDSAALRFRDEAIPAFNRFVESRGVGETIRTAILAAKKSSLGIDLDQVLKWGEDKPFTRFELTQAWETGLAEGEDPSTVWGMVQGLTAHARSIPFANMKVSLERRAGDLLSSTQG